MYVHMILKDHVCEICIHTLSSLASEQAQGQTFPQINQTKVDQN